MIHVLSKILGRKRPGNNDNNSNPPSNGPCPRMKEGQSIWQKATSLRQSLRQSSRVKLGQKSGFEFTSLPSSDKCATLGPSSSKSQQAHKEWGSQRNLARERRSLAAVKPMSSDELAASKRSLHSRSLCMSGDWDMDDVNNTKQPRSPRKLTKDSGYETSAQCDPDYANSLSDWLSEEKVIGETAVPARAILPDKKDPRDLRGLKGKDERLEWNIRHRPLSFSHQEVTSECAKSHRQLRHSYSQREVSRRQVSVDTLTNSTTDLKNPHVTSVESVGAWSGNNPAVTKSTPHLLQGRNPRQTASSSNLLHSEPEEPGVNNMVTRRFKKGSVYDALASTSGLDFAPVVQLKAFNSRREESSSLMQAPKPPEKIWEKTHASKLQLDSPAKNDDSPVFTDLPQNKPVTSALNLMNSPTKTSEVKRTPSASKFDGSEAAKCLTAHEKYPSWPVVDAESPSVSHRSHSWTGKTDYPKEKIAYSRPKKSHQYKISTNQLQPVLERAPDYNTIKCPEALIADAERNHTKESFRVEYTGSSIPPEERNGKQYPGCSSSGECNGKQFDFEAFHTPSIPECFEDKDYRIHSPPERDGSSTSPSSKAASEAPAADSNGFLSRYEEVLGNQTQYSSPLSTWNKQRPPQSIVGGGSITPDTPFLDRLRLDNGLQLPPPPPVPIQPLAAVPQLQQQLQQDIELSSENGTWMGSMESSSHGRGLPKWQGSYSDLSTLSTQLSNRSSLFDSGHSTMPESGRLSPQSSCDSTAPSLLLEGPTRAQVVARHGCHREIVAHSARVEQPERHGSESILYYATGTTRYVQEGRSPSKSVDGAACSSHMTAEESLYRSHASLTLSPSQETKINKCPSRQDSRKSSNSYSSDDSYSRPRGALGDDTSGSSSDVSNITCISNYKGSGKPTEKRSDKSSRDIMKPKPLDQTFPKYKPNLEPPKSKSMDETARKFVFPDTDKRQRVSDPELKAIQKQAVMSFYQRMSLASESTKSETKSLIHAPGADNEPPPPYEASSSKLKMPLPKLSLPKVIGKQLPPRPIVNQISPKPKLPMKASEAGLLNAHSKSVPNLMMFKGQNLDLPASHPIFKKPFGSKMGESQGNKIEKKRGSPLANDEIISWVQLPNVLEKQREAMERAAPSSESKDPPEDNGGCSSGMQYLKPHKSPRKVQLKEVHHSNETASVKVMTPDGVTLVQTAAKGPQKRRPAPPPPPKQPPRRPPPPPPPVTPPPSEVMVLVDEVEGSKEDKKDHKIEVSPSHLVSSASSPQLLHGSYAHPSPTGETNGPASPELPLPPPPSAEGNEVSLSDEPLPPPPDPTDVDVQSRTLDSSSLIYPKNSYMSYRSEKKYGRQGFDGKYHRSFRSSASSMDLTTCDSSFQDGKKVFSPNSWEQIHNIRQHGTTVIFHSDCLQGNLLQRSSSQDFVPVEETANVTDHISNVGFQSSQSNQSSDSISAQCSEAQDHQQSVPYQPSHEKVPIEVQNSPSNSQNQNLLSAKGLSLKSKNSADVIINCETDTPLDNQILKDGGLTNIENDSNVDLNQNSLKNNRRERESSKIMNGNDLINRINCATQTTDTPRMYRKCRKSKEELECEQLSREFIHHYGDSALKNLLVPAPNHKTMTDYLEGLLNLEFEKNGHQDLHNTISSTRNQSAQKKENCSNNEKCNSPFESIKNDSNEKNGTEKDNENVDNDLEMKKRKEELMLSIGKKVERFKGEETNIRAEINQNELLGQKIANRLQELAKPNEIEKYSLHVEEMEKIVNLLLSLSGRLARAENLLKNLPNDCNSEEKKILESKRNKLRDQHEDACRLKESIDRRSNQVSTFLRKYFSDLEYSDYDHFIKMKTKLIVDIRENDEKINLGVEQLAALSVVAHLWKSANS